MLADVADLLACPECRGAVEIADRTVLCQRGHSFDIARQGYVSLLTGASTKISGDTPEMIAARAAFLDAGHFDPIATAIADAVEASRGAELSQYAESSGKAVPPRILELGAGTGHYLCRVVDAYPDAEGLGLDISKAAARRVARIHPRIASVVADAWQRLPILDGTLTHALSIFAPRNPDEIRRVLCDDGAFVVVTPTSGHLAELIEPLGMVRVEEDKTRRLGESMSGRFDRVERTPVGYAMTLNQADVDAVVAMGPSAHHQSARQRAELIAQLPEHSAVTASVVVSTYRRRLAITLA